MRVYLWLILSWFAIQVSAEELYFIDAHSQVDHQVDDLSLIIKRMDEFNVRQTILATRGKRRLFSVADLADQYPHRIVPAVRSKGGIYKRNDEKYYRKVDKQFADDRFKAVAEVLMYHAQKGDKAQEVVVYPDDQRVKAILDPAIERGLPFVIHIEFAALEGNGRRRFMQEMEALLDQYPEHPFLLIHMGQLEAEEAESLLQQHSNFHLMTSHADTVTVNNSSQPWINMFDGEQFKPAWEKLMIAYPEQFVFALDNVWADHWRNTYNQHMELWKNALAALPGEVAHAIAHGNAERLWKLP